MPALMRMTMLLLLVAGVVGAMSPLAGQALACASCGQSVLDPNACTPGSAGGVACSFSEKGTCREVGTCSTQIVGTRQTPAGHELFEVVVGPDLLIAERASPTDHIRIASCRRDGRDQVAGLLVRPTLAQLVRRPTRVMEARAIP